MDEEMEENTVMYTFTAIEIDLDYEFDAARFFDFSRDESLAETLEAELWFQSRGSYPPSPFVKKLVLRDDVLPDNVTASTKTDVLENMDVSESDSDSGGDMEILGMNAIREECEEINGRTSIELNSSTQTMSDQCSNVPTDLKFYDCKIKLEAKRNTIVKKSLPRISTLMKPTASQLAKQNQTHKMGDLRFFKLENYKSSVTKFSPLESQPAKRQKLEGGQLRKFTDTHQQTHLAHKEPKKDKKGDANLAHAKLRLTIPKEPAFVTAQRAQRMRPKVREQEQLMSTAPTFRARPLNRKMLEAPSMLLPKRSTPRIPEFQEFHLKTSERAMQHNVPSSSAHSSKPKVLHKIAECSNNNFRRTHVINAPKQEGCEVVHKFKAITLNKKIFSSKGDTGDFRNNKKEMTVPMESNLHTERRVQHDPPVELFNMLTLTSEIRPSTGPHSKLPRPTRTLPKGTKENKLASFQQETELMAQPRKPSQGKATCLKPKQIPAHTGVTKIGVPSAMSRSSSVH
ncbi:Cell cycle regulated microtubule associated protein [Heracleum sosnowskyi]|uniref:Cell cycle regulated microtubule associated protein n=1 Tax=Heracleum sosnowskyi TaxID=360622 RepID=A0AAD8I0J2_9APIA|nr:Cell cycle regulated microtubule associated protein [Heracleum sosnowskyi]